MLQYSKYGLSFDIMILEKIQLAELLDHSNHPSVELAMLRLLSEGFGAEVVNPVRHAFWLTIDIFEGRFPGYQRCNTDYHNLYHTLDVFVATIRLLDGHRLAGVPFTSQQVIQLTLGALLHDVGYIQTLDDTSGSGAKYTKTHVKRGVEFLQRHYSAFGINAAQVPEISKLIYSTDLALECDQTLSSTILATADLMGQMADRAYLEKLLFLYNEFKEAGFDNYQTAFDLLKSTKSFYQVILNRMDNELHKTYQMVVYHFQHHLGLASNLYMVAISNQMEYLQGIMDDTTTNFRKKLKRIDLEGL